MNTYLRVANLGVKQALEFRTRIFLWITVYLSPFVVVPFFWVFVLFEKASTQYTSENIITYYALVVFVATFTSSSVSMRVVDDIVEGEIVPHIIKPVSYIKYRFAVYLGSKVVSTTMIIILFITAHVVFPKYILPPFSGPSFLFFTSSLVLAACLTFCIQMLVALTAFWWGRTPSVGQAIYWLQGLFGGQYAPLTFYPSPVMFVASMLPFRFLYAVPAGMYGGIFSVEKMIELTVIEVIWIILLVVIMSMVWKKGIRTYDSPGV